MHNLLRQSPPHCLCLLDGGMGRELDRRGVSVSEDIWSASALYSAPDTVLAIHHDFVEAGARILTANTFGLTPAALRAGGKAKDWLSLFELAVSLARQAAVSDPTRGVLVAASLPPLGATYRPDLVPPWNQLLREYEQFVEASDRLGVDVILAETLSSLVEARAVLHHTRGIHPKIWISFTVNARGDLRSGEPVERAAETVFGAEADALLVNCAPVEHVTKALKRLRVVARERLVGAYANRFDEVPVDYSWEQDGPNPLRGLSTADYARHARDWFRCGARIIGGCCGIGPDYIARLSEEQSWNGDGE